LVDHPTTQPNNATRSAAITLGLLQACTSLPTQYQILVITDQSGENIVEAVLNANNLTGTQFVSNTAITEGDLRTTAVCRLRQYWLVLASG